MPELKFFDVALSDPSITATLLKLNVVQVPQGSDESERIGREIYVEAIEVKGICTLNNGVLSTQTSNEVAVRLIADYQTNKAAFAADQYLVTDSILSFENPVNSERFETLKHEILHLEAKDRADDGAAGLETSIFTQYFHLICDCCFVINYDNSDTDGAVDTQTACSLWFATQSFIAETVSIDATIRVWYFDS